MAENLTQFDALLGGEQELPQDVSLMNFASARAIEIFSIAETLQEPPKTGLLFQRLPRHMRRRVMSHNAKRMPRQLREAHRRQMEKGGLPPKSKRPSRKYRRRPSNLLEAYNRRQRENIWLETHLWHAKRFHMINKWGYRLPHFPNDKSARACYRGASNHCLIQDISYYACIEIEGKFGSIINRIGMLTRPECGLSFNAKTWRRGDSEGSVTLFHHDMKYPYGAIGNVRFLWKPLVTCTSKGGDGNFPSSQGQSACTSVKWETPRKDDDGTLDWGGDVNQQRKLWIWVHPSLYEEVKRELITVFEFQRHTPPLDGTEPPVKKMKLEQAMSSNPPYETDNCKSSSFGHSEALSEKIMRFSGNNISMSVLKDTLVRFRLMGPLSNAVLRDAFLLAPPRCQNDHPSDSKWWEQWENIFKIQNQAWMAAMDGVLSPAMLPAHVVIGLTICDPRSNFPKKRTKAVDKDIMPESDETSCSVPIEACLSPIWDSKIRDIVTESKPSDAEVHQKYSKNIVPGIAEEIDPDNDSTTRDLIPKLPILLLQQPGCQDPSNGRLGYRSGWDLIGPAGWGKALWLALVMRGARAAGIKDAEILENDGIGPSLCWPPPPDTSAGKLEMQQLEKEAKQKYFRLPPAKRPNYIKLGICSPFSSPWHILCQEWSSSPPGNASADEYYILRDRNKLKHISDALQRLKKEVPVKTPQIIGVNQSPCYEFLLTDIEKDCGDRCLVPVRVTMVDKGTVSKSALVCLPDKGDVIKCARNSLRLQCKEPIKGDPYQEERQMLRKQHKEELRKLRRRRLKWRKEADEVDGNPSRPLMGAMATQEMCSKFKAKMESMFLPEAKSVRTSCSREVAGYVISGAFSFPCAKEMGLAYITLQALLKLCTTKAWNPKLFIFVRNTSSLHYFPATVEVITF